MLSIAEVLTDPCMRYAELLAGRAGLWRPLRWVHSAELLRIAGLLEGGELLLSTGLSLAGETVQTQRAFLDSLAAKNISALAFELVTSFHELPEFYLEWADRQAIPLLAFRREVSFSSIAHRLAQRIFTHDAVQPLANAPHMPVDDEDTYARACMELQPLLQLPDKKRLRLMQTLHVILQLHFNMSKAARTLGLRRQSLYYRYTQLEELVGDLRTDPALGGRLFLALNVWKRHGFFDTVSVEPRVCGA